MGVLYRMIMHELVRMICAIRALSTADRAPVQVISDPAECQHRNIPNSPSNPTYVTTTAIITAIIPTIIPTNSPVLHISRAISQLFIWVTVSDRHARESVECHCVRMPMAALREERRRSIMHVGMVGRV